GRKRTRHRGVRHRGRRPARRRGPRDHRLPRLPRRLLPRGGAPARRRLGPRRRRLRPDERRPVRAAGALGLPHRRTVGARVAERQPVPTARRLRHAPRPAHHAGVLARPGGHAALVRQLGRGDARRRRPVRLRARLHRRQRRVRAAAGLDARGGVHVLPLGSPAGGARGARGRQEGRSGQAPPCAARGPRGGLRGELRAAGGAARDARDRGGAHTGELRVGVRARARARGARARGAHPAARPPRGPGAGAGTRRPRSAERGGPRALQPRRRTSSDAAGLHGLRHGPRRRRAGLAVDDGHHAAPARHPRGPRARALELRHLPRPHRRRRRAHPPRAGRLRPRGHARLRPRRHAGRQRHAGLAAVVARRAPRDHRPPAAPAGPAAAVRGRRDADRPVRGRRGARGGPGSGRQV
ncbi:MAG: hypothetical protein AVDCRST_MAG53-1229, partial [uncultured Solirubrobacteraceae bacterium]